MATFFSNTTVWYWGSTAYLVRGTLTGNVSRSGNTVTLSGLSMSLSWPPYASGAWDVSFSLNGVAVYSARLGANTGSISLNNYSFGVSEGQTSANVGWSSSDGYSGSFVVSFPSGSTPPSGGSMSFVSATWDSVTVKGKVTNWGSGSNPTKHFAVLSTSATGNDWNNIPRIEKYVDGNSTAEQSATISNANADGTYYGGITVKGGTAFKVGMAYGTSVSVLIVGDYTTRYTPPAPLQTLSKASETYAGNNKATVTLSVTGGNSTANNNVSVSTQYRCSLDGGSTWTAWAIAGTGTPWTAVSASITVPCDTSVKVEAKQVYQGNSSEIKSLTFTSMKTPAMLYVPVSGQSKLGRKAYIGINGQSEKVLKIYKGVNGQAKLVYTD